jgi:hypothetical protein
VTLLSPADKERSSLGKVRARQHMLYRAAKADSGRRFHTLMDKIWRRDVLNPASDDTQGDKDLCRKIKMVGLRAGHSGSGLAPEAQWFGLVAKADEA